MFIVKEKDNNSWCIVDTKTGECMSDKMHIHFNDGRPHFGGNLSKEEAKEIAGIMNMHLVAKAEYN